MKNPNRTFVMNIDESGRVVFEKGTRNIPDPVGPFERYHAEVNGTTLVAMTVFGSNLPGADKPSGLRHERDGKVITLKGVQFRIGGNITSILISGEDMRAFVMLITESVMEEAA